MLQSFGSVEETQERIPIFTACEPAIGWGIQLLGHHKIADGFVDSRDKLEEWRVPDCEPISW